MPKIVFRPNPTPPPFVPPTPSYATQLDIQCNPLPFDNDSGVALVISEANLPPFDLFTLLKHNENTGMTTTLLSMDASEFVFGEVIYASPETSSENATSYIAEFKSGTTVVLSIPAILSPAE